jgi:uncharacterized protein YegP (UPF0339 family)
MILLSHHWQFYKDKYGQWQWRKYVAKKVVAVSAEGFRSHKACVDDAKKRGYIIPEKFSL